MKIRHSGNHISRQIKAIYSVAVKAHDCPTCKAKAGNKCLSSTGNSVNKMNCHISRVESAARKIGFIK